jgi:hypothetical protein
MGNKLGKFEGFSTIYQFQNKQILQQKNCNIIKIGGGWMFVGYGGSLTFVKYCTGILLIIIIC